MTKRRTHSSIDKLPEDLRQAITAMLIDGEWPSDMPLDGSPKGKPRYEDIQLYIEQQGHSVSVAAVGRWARPLLSLAMLAGKRNIVTAAMGSIDSQTASQSQKVAVELITAQAMDLILSGEDLTAKQICDISRAFKDCASVAIQADKYAKQQIEEKARAAAIHTKEKLTSAGVDRKLIQEIIDEHLGVVKS